MDLGSLLWTSTPALSDGVLAYRARVNDLIDVTLVSTISTTNIINSPECAGVLFQDHLSQALWEIASALCVLDDHPLARIKVDPVDVLYLLRGGLNFNLHQVLPKVARRSAEVSFLSSQRVPAVEGFTIGENAYRKWSIQDDSILCVGDISATGTTIAHALDVAINEYGAQGKTPKRLAIFTIGTPHLIDTLNNSLERLVNAWGPQFQGISVIYIEGLFALYKGHPSLEATHLPWTDFFRKGAPRTSRFEEYSFRQPLCLIERCAIYDGGSRSFEPQTYLGNVRRYWERLLESGSRLNIFELLEAKTDLHDYALSFEQWNARMPWWASVDRGSLRLLHERGQQVLRGFEKSSLETLCKARIQALTTTSH
jgi:hypothetical protein